jgi:hypothetical protein
MEAVHSPETFLQVGCILQNAEGKHNNRHFDDKMTPKSLW